MATIRHSKGFTLVELLIALIIIGILAGALLLTMANTQAKAEATKVVSDLRNLKSAAILYYVDKGKIPETRGSAGWSLWSVTSLQPYVEIDLSKYRLSGINSEGLTTSSFESNVKKGYSLYIMGAGNGSYSSKIGKLAFVAAWIGDKPIATKRALEAMAVSTPLYNGNYTEYVGQQKTGALPFYKADSTSDLNKNLIVMRVF
jgi:prepilin-type N-terminal cleavage/methylation domain-containing protein